MDKLLNSRKFYIFGAIIAFAAIAAVIMLMFLAAPKEGPAEIKNISIEQKGLNVEVRWDPVECEEYEITVKKGLFDTQTRKVESSGFRIRNIEPEKDYNIEIVALLENGETSEPGFASIETKKLKQEITTDVEKVNGFEKDSAVITASGKGAIEYSSNNEDIASVDDKGKVTLNKEGKTTIMVKASGDDRYGETKKKIEVTVFSDNIPQVKGVKAENVSASRAVISWKKSDFASEYHVMKMNVATKEYADILTVTAEENSAEVTRDDGSYAVKAVAVSGEKRAEGKISKPVEIRGTTEEATTYSSGKTIMKLDGSNMNLFREVHGDGNTTIPQSLSMVGDYYVVSYVNMSGTSGKLISYRKTDGECVDITPAGSMGHANGTTYNPNTNRFYVVKTHKGIRTASCSAYDGSTKELIEVFNLPKVTSGIAYDISNNKFYLSKGNEIYVCDSEFNVEKFIWKSIRYNHAQDIGAYNGTALVCTWVSGNTSYIDMYRVSDGKYLGSYDVSIGEIESCIVDDGYLVILMNTRGSSKDRIYKTKERIAIP